MTLDNTAANATRIETNRALTINGGGTFRVIGEEPHLSHLRGIFDVMVKRLGLVVGDLGVDTAGDSTGLAGRAASSDKLKHAEVKQGLPQLAEVTTLFINGLMASDTGVSVILVGRSFVHAWTFRDQNKSHC
ncbi:MAG: hypothetical protein WCL32_23960 [Planctomycetota bacterium]